MKDKLKQAIKVYDKIAKMYSNHSYEKLQQYQLGKFVSLLKGKKVLDIGCGIGRDTEYLTEDGFDVVGIDISENMVKEAKKNFSKGKFKVMDFRKMSFKDKSFNGLWSMSSFQHIGRKEAVKVLKEFSRILDNKGVLYLAVYEGEGEEEVIKYVDEPRYFYLYKKEEMEKNLDKAGFSVVISEVNDTKSRNWLEIYARKK